MYLDVLLLVLHSLVLLLPIAPGFGDAQKAGCWLVAGGLRAFLHWLAPNRMMLNPSDELSPQDLPFEALYRGKCVV